MSKYAPFRYIHAHNLKDNYSHCYGQWRRFERAIERAITSCKESGNKPNDHFAGAGKMMGIEKGAQHQVNDFQLSRFVCYLRTADNWKYDELLNWLIRSCWKNNPAIFIAAGLLEQLKLKDQSAMQV